MAVSASHKKKASRFYDGYHQASAQDDDQHPNRVKTAVLQREWVRTLAPAKGAKLLDLSCGLGHFLKVAGQERPDLALHGLDHSPYAVKAAQARVPKGRFKVGDALRTGYASGAFDAVTCLGSLEHYPDSDKGLAEIARILKPGGQALVYVPNLFYLGYIYLTWRTGETPHEAGQNEFERFETRQGWEDLIRKNGFKVLKVTKHNAMYATERMPGWMKLAYSLFVEPFVPLNLSYCFSFYIEKEGRRAAS